MPDASRRRVARRLLGVGAPGTTPPPVSAVTTADKGADRAMATAEDLVAEATVEAALEGDGQRRL